jgi:hypothetical protein
MKAPKYPIYIVTILFVTGMLISPWLENKFLIWGLIIIPFFGALFKKYRPLVYLVFLPLGSIHHQQFFVSPNQITVILQPMEMKKPSLYN